LGNGGAGLIQSESIGGEYGVTYETRSASFENLLPQTRDRLAPFVSVIP
jgi:hypothetical protein